MDRRSPRPTRGTACGSGPVAGGGWPALLRSGVAFAARSAAAVGAFALVLYLTDIGCVFRTMTGVPCPGCGMTRAWLAALRGDLPAAIAYHPLFWAVPVAFALVWVERLPAARGPVARRALLVASVVLLAALLVVYAARMASPADAGLLFGGHAPAGVPSDVIHLERPVWMRLLGR